MCCICALDWLAGRLRRLQPDELPAAFDAAESRRRAVAERVRVQTPDPYMNAAVPAICSAADGIWEPPVYMHGGVAWHMPYLGWRGAYVASEFGWHDRAQMHFRAFADVQLKEPATGQPHADPESNLARQASDSVIYSRGYIPVHPRKDARNPYDMQQVYIDQLLWHLLWTGDLEFAREMWPVLVDHLQWEKRCFDPDDDGLYENVANTFISDAHHYSGGACTQASAYNYRAFLLAGRLAKLLGEDPVPWEHEATKIRDAMNRVLWMPRSGWYAEYRDLLGLQRLHPERRTAERLSSDRLGRARSIPGLADAALRRHGVRAIADRRRRHDALRVQLGAVHLEHPRRVRRGSGAHGPGQLAGGQARAGVRAVARGDSSIRCSAAARRARASARRNRRAGWPDCVPILPTPWACTAARSSKDCSASCPMRWTANC